MVNGGLKNKSSTRTVIKESPKLSNSLQLPIQQQHNQLISNEDINTQNGENSAIYAHSRKTPQFHHRANTIESVCSSDFRDGMYINASGFMTDQTIQDDVDNIVDGMNYLESVENIKIKNSNI
jgi:hypothetical protein